MNNIEWVMPFLTVLGLVVLFVVGILALFKAFTSRSRRAPR